MLNIEKSQTAGVYTLNLEGTITESAELKGDVPGDAKRLDVFCKNLTRINSMGITKWILFFRELRKRSIEIRYFDLPVAVVNLCNFVSGMVEKGEVQSFHLPYFCEACNTEFEVLRTSENLKPLLAKADAQLAELPCSNCGKTAQFDGTPKNYLEFLKP